MDLPLLDSLTDTGHLLLNDTSDSSDPFSHQFPNADGEPDDSALMWAAELDLVEHSHSHSQSHSHSYSHSHSSTLQVQDQVLSQDATSLQTDCAEGCMPSATEPKNELVLFPFQTTAMPLANSVPHVPHHPVVSTQPEFFERLGSPLQENRNHNSIRNRAKVAVGPGSDTKKFTGKQSRSANTTKKQPSAALTRTLSQPLKLEPGSPSSPKSKDKLAQRKLRNKESARRYREKQVARRRQLENYTRTLTEQNRELESLHDRLLTLTCERRVRGVADANPRNTPNVTSTLRVMPPL